MLRIGLNNEHDKTFGDLGGKTLLQMWNPAQLASINATPAR
jgi:hypothetical protein